MPARESLPDDALLATFRALGDPVRLSIVRFLIDQGGVCCATPGRVCACDIVAALGLSQPTVSHHMAILTQSGLVSGRKVGKWMHYTLDRDRCMAAGEWLAGIGRHLVAAQAA
jgi:ArsR family transcriptional regulator